MAAPDGGHSGSLRSQHPEPQRSLRRAGRDGNRYRQPRLRRSRRRPPAEPCPPRRHRLCGQQLHSHRPCLGHAGLWWRARRPPQHHPLHHGPQHHCRRQRRGALLRPAPGRHAAERAAQALRHPCRRRRLGNRSDMRTRRPRRRGRGHCLGAEGVLAGPRGPGRGADAHRTRHQHGHARASASTA